MIFLHIGLNKSGSSSIQGFCDRHRGVLRDLGLDYPAVGIHDSAHYGVSKRLLNKPDAAQVPDADGLEDAVHKALAAGRHVLLSSEYFFLADDGEAGRIHDFMAGFGVECRVMVYLRRHDQWIASLFNQALKTAPRYSPWQSDIRDYTLHLLGTADFETRYSVIVDRWAGHFGAGAMVVRPFEAAQFHLGDFVWDFLAQIDPAIPVQLREQGLVPKRVNEAVPEHVLRAIDAIRSAGLDADATRFAIAQLLRAGRAAEPTKHARRPWDGRMFELPQHLRRSIVRMFAEDYRHIAERYLDAPDAVLFQGSVN